MTSKNKKGWEYAKKVSFPRNLKYTESNVATPYHHEYCILEIQQFYQIMICKVGSGWLCMFVLYVLVLMIFSDAVFFIHKAYSCVDIP